MRPKTKKTLILCGKIIVFFAIGKTVPIYGPYIVLSLVIGMLVTERHVKIVRISQRDMERIKRAA